MLIVLTLSRDRSRCDDLRADLASHGGPHRFVSLEGATDIASGYDALVERSGAGPDDLLCFLHEDARLHFAAGDVLARVAEAIPRAGVLGFCGTAAQQPGRAWWRCPPRYGGVRQGAVDPVDLRFRAPTREAAGVAVEPVDALDGYCLVLRRGVLDAVGGFGGSGVGWHGYDVDLCLRVRAAGFVNHVLDLPTSHWSWGAADDDLAAALAQQTERWGAVLDPASSSAVAARAPEPTPAGPTGRPSVHVYGLGLDEFAAVEGFVASCGEADGVHVLDLGSTDGTVASLAAGGVDVVSAVAAPGRADVARNLALELVPDDVDVCVALDVGERLVDGWRAEVERAWHDGATSLRHRVRVGDRWWPPPQELAAVRVHRRRDHVWMGAVHPRLWVVHGTEAREAEVATVLVARADLEPGPVDGRDDGRGDEAARLVAALEADGCDGPSALLLALEAARADRWDDAVSLIDRALGSGRLSPVERSLACVLRSEAPGEPEEWWLLRACDEDPTLAGAWLELADRNRRDGDATGAWWAARWALAADGVPPEPWPVAPEWRSMGDDLAAWAAWELGLVDEARHHAFAALVADPFDERLRDDHRAVERAAVGAVRSPEVTGPAAVDVVVLSYAKTRREYDLTGRCIEALRAASPSVPMRIVVVETNEHLRDEPFVADEGALFGGGVTVVHPGRDFAYNTFLRAGLATLDVDAAPAVLVLNNDIDAFSEGFVEELLGALDVVDSASPLGVREGLWWQPPGDAAVVVDDHVSRGLVGWCILVRRDVLDEVGAEVCFPDDLVWYEQDTRYAEVLRANGRRHGVARRARALHLQSASHALLGESLALPSSVPEILRALGLRGLRCVVSGGDDELVSWVRSYQPGELVLAGVDAGAGHGAPFDRVVVLDGGGTIDAGTLLGWWALVRPAGWLVGRHPDGAAVCAALEGFRAATGVASSVRRGADVATHWALQAPS